MDHDIAPLQSWSLDRFMDHGLPVATIIDRIIEAPRRTSPEDLAQQDPEVTALWHRVSSRGPFAWVVDVETTLRDELGAPPGAQSWIHPKAAHDIGRRGWITWSFPVLAPLDVHRRIFPVSPDWLRRVHASSQADCLISLIKAIRQASQEAPLFMALTLAGAKEIAEESVANGLLRLPNPRLCWLLRKVTFSDSRHALIGARMRLARAFPDITPETDPFARSLMAIISGLEGEVSGKSTDHSFAIAARDTALLILSGDIQTLPAHLEDARNWRDGL